MEKKQKELRVFGLIGKNIGYSFSPRYFAQKFKDEGIEGCEYRTFDLNTIEELPELLKSTSNLCGLNVTIPYKKQVIPYLDEIDEQARTIGAVNTIQRHQKKLKGYNTDFYGFSESLRPFLEPYHTRALVLGTGGAAKAVRYALRQLGITSRVVSRRPTGMQLHYKRITPELLDGYYLIINCTPLGTYPDVGQAPELPYKYLTDRHLLYDLIYNPSQTTFLKRGVEQGATVVNGLSMLQLQAEKAWEIWNS